MVAGQDSALDGRDTLSHEHFKRLAVHIPSAAFTVRVWMRCCEYVPLTDCNGWVRGVMSVQVGVGGGHLWPFQVPAAAAHLAAHTLARLPDTARL